MNHRRPRLVRLRRFIDREPFEVYISALCVVVGGPLLVNGAAPATVEESLPDPLVALWGLELVIGGILTLVGLASDQPRIERGGLTLLAASAGLYALVLVVVAWPAGLFAAGIVLGFALACLRRRSSMKRTITLHTAPRDTTE